MSSPPKHALFTESQKKDFLRGDTIIDIDTPVTHAWRLDTGAVKMVSYTRGGVEVLHHILTPQSVFPLFNLFDEKPRSEFGFVCMTPVTVSCIPYPTYRLCVMSDIALQKDALRKMIGAVRGLTRRIQTLSYDNTRIKLAHILCYLYTHFHTQGGVLDIHITHQELASMTGASRETISREWEKLTKEGYVSMKNDHIVVSDIRALTAVCELCDD